MQQIAAISKQLHSLKAIKMTRAQIRAQIQALRTQAELVGITYTIFIDVGTGVEDLDLPEGTSLTAAVDQAVALSKDYRHHSSLIRVGQLLLGAKEYSLIWANENWRKQAHKFFS